MVGLSHYLVLGALLFVISVIGIFLNRKNVIILLMCIELMLLAVNLNCLLYTSPSPRDGLLSRMPSSA